VKGKKLMRCPEMVAFQAMGMIGFLMASSSPDAAAASNSTASTTSSFIFSGSSCEAKRKRSGNVTGKLKNE
jgi:hypothetical protein